ncbi:hypothetical protein PMAYCL1PPCAC_19701, partial [Pristionchus mayeri]
SSSFVSWMLTVNCEQEQVNQCCIDHDACYDSCQVRQSQCDQVFCDCLSSVTSSPQCKNHTNLYCSAVKLLGHNYICREYAENPFELMKPIVLPSPEFPILPIQYQSSPSNVKSNNPLIQYEVFPHDDQ